MANLVYMVGIGTIDFNSVRGEFGVQRKGVVGVIRDKFRVDLPFGEQCG